MTNQTRTVSIEERRAAYDHVFGNVNVAATKRLNPDDPKAQEMRVGKSKRDKANGHSSHTKNVRLWEGGAGGKKGGSAGQWVKVNR